MQINPTGWEAYRSAFRADAHQLLAWGYQDARPLIGPDSDETEITGLIADAIEKRLDDPRTDDRFFYLYDVSDERPIAGEGRTGSRRRRADIRIRSRAFRPGAKCIFEAKRLSQSGHTVGTYIGQEGLLRFVNPTSYSVDAAEMAMIGYVQSGTLDEWMGKLLRALEGKAVVESLALDGMPKPLASEAGFSHCLLTVHRRPGNNVISVSHIMLDCN